MKIVLGGVMSFKFLGAVVQAPRPMSRREREDEEEENRGNFVFNC